MKGYSFTELAKLVEAAMPRAGGAFSGNVSAPRFIGPLQGNADTATAAGRADRLTTARSLTIGSTTKAFDGTGNLSWSLAEIGAINTSATVAAAHKWATPRALQIGDSSKAVDGTANVAWSLAEIGAIAKNTGNVLQNSGFGVGFLSSGASNAQWIASYFGDNAATGGRVVVGTLTTDLVNSYATIGGHNASLTAWAPLAINPGADGTATVYVGMNPAASSGNGNLFVGNDVESNYMRLRSPIPNDSRYVVNKGYVDGKFAPIAHRENWVDKGIHTQTAYGIGWNAYGNGHIICDASAGAIEGVSVPRTDAQIAWDNVNGATLVGWNGQSTFGVRVDRARLADSANWSAQSNNAITADRITGVVGTNGQDLTIHGKRAMVGIGDANQLMLNYGNDWGSTAITGHLYAGSIDSSRHIVFHNGATHYGNAGLEIRSTDGSAAILGLHRAGFGSVSVGLHGDGGVEIKRGDGSTRGYLGVEWCDSSKYVYVDGGWWAGNNGLSYESNHFSDAPFQVNFGGVPAGSYVPIVSGVAYTSGHGFTTRAKFGMRTHGGWSVAELFVGSAEASAEAGHPRAIYSFDAFGNFSAPGQILAVGEFKTTAPNSYRHIFENYGTFWHQNGSHLYLMLTNAGDQHGSYNGLRPFTVNLVNGVVSVGNGLQVGGGIHSGSRQIAGDSGDLYDIGARVYSPNNPPTPAAIGAAAADHSQWRLVAAGDVTVAMANHATGSLRATIDTGINSAHGFVHDASKYRAVIHTNDITTSNPAACTWGAYGTLRALARWNGPHTIQLDIYSFGTSMTKGNIYRWEVYEVI